MEDARVVDSGAGTSGLGTCDVAAGFTASGVLLTTAVLAVVTERDDFSELALEVAVCVVDESDNDEEKEKDRDKDGKLTLCNVPLYQHEVFGYDEYKGKDFIIIDDICDGGATFINIAKWFKDRTMQNKIYLIVTHGIFSKGFGELQQYFDGIYTTNSYQDLNPDTQLFIKQLNVY